MKTPLLPTSDLAKRFAAIFHRKLTTPWSPKEVRVFRDLSKTIDDDDLRKIERRYKAQWPPNSQKNTLRHDLYTFLNHYPGEIDRANTYEYEHPLKTERKIIPMPPVYSEQPAVTGDPAEVQRFLDEYQARKQAKAK